MTLSTWLTFLVAACFISISPGSGAVLSMSHGLNYGFKKASVSIMGLLAGMLLLLVIAGAGVGSILVASEMAFNLIKTIGALYLMYLGISQWRAKISENNAVSDASQHSSGATTNMIPDWRKRFLSGFFTNATNPKGIIFMVAVLPQFINHTTSVLPQLVILGATLCMTDLIVMHGYAYAAASMQRFFRDPALIKKQNRFFGGILIGIGAALFFVKRSPAS